MLNKRKFYSDFGDLLPQPKRFRSAEGQYSHSDAISPIPSSGDDDMVQSPQLKPMIPVLLRRQITPPCDRLRENCISRSVSPCPETNILRSFSSDVSKDRSRLLSPLPSTTGRPHLVHSISTCADATAALRVSSRTPSPFPSHTPGAMVGEFHNNTGHGVMVSSPAGGTGSSAMTNLEKQMVRNGLASAETISRLSALQHIVMWTQTEDEKMRFINSALQNAPMPGPASGIAGEARHGLIVFCNTANSVERVTNWLRRNQWIANGVHGSRCEKFRRETFTEFIEGRLQCIILTDAMKNIFSQFARRRGGVRCSHTIQFELPPSIDTYINRCTFVCGERHTNAQRVMSSCLNSHCVVVNHLRKLLRELRQPMAF
eukprot:g6029.t1